MGCLDPKLDKERVFELLRKKSATKAVLEFEGGNDEGGVHKITLFVALANGEIAEQDLEVWYCGGYRYVNGKEVPISTWKNEDQELSELLQGPVDTEYGTWAGEFSAYGTLTWWVSAGSDESGDHEAGTVVMENNVQSDYEYSREEW